jgi:glycosyltransferase involved in cell wall biosynthesis
MEGKVPTPWGEPLAQADGVSLWLRTPPPGEVGPAFLHGAVISDGAPVQRVDLASLPAMAVGMPSPGLAAEHGPQAQRAIFWGLAPTAAASIDVTLADGRRVRLKVSEPLIPAPALPRPPAARITICMATYEPPPELFERQIESIAAQTEDAWICVINDDSSSAGATEAIARATAGDERFFVSHNERRLGAFANFGAAMELVGESSRYVALADQDDVWDPEKLARLGEVLERTDARLAFSDMRVVEADGRVVSDTYWTKRVPNHDNFASLLLGNSVTGAASMFRRELLGDALPLPPKFGNLYHDHWLALVAAATGGVAYVDEPLYDYVQHADAVIGHAGANRGVVGGSFLRRLAALRGRPSGDLRAEWRRIYFGEYCRMALSAVALEQRLGSRLAPGHQRALERALALDHSPTALAWLISRQARRLWHDDTGGSEAGMLRGLLWRRRVEDGDLPPEMLTPPGSDTL